MSARIFWSTLVLVCITSIPLGAMPSYSQVVDYFQKQYAPILPDSLEYNLAKDRSGWQLCVWRQHPKPTLIERWPLWDRNTQAYVKLPLPVRKPNQLQKSYRFYTYSSTTLYAFDRCLYYGYPGWDDEVIEDTPKMESITDTLLESLARAYSNKGMTYLWSQYEYATIRSECPPAAFNQYITSKCLDNYIYYTNKGLDTYKLLSEKYPTYETLVGIASVKYALEYFYAYHTLSLTHRVPESQNPYRQKGLFNQALLNIGYCYLNSLDSNAIFFTNGDLDTYITMYLQSVYGYRTDVTVVNLSMLNLARYTWTFSTGKHVGASLDMQIKPQITLQSKFDFLLHHDRESPQGNNMWHINDWIKLLNDTLNTYRYYDDNQTYLVVPAQKLHYTVDKQPMVYQYSTYYLMRGDVALLDIISTNGDTRPIYFTYGLDPAVKASFEPYLWATGFAYKLMPERHNSDRMFFDSVAFKRHQKVGFPFVDTTSLWVYKHAPYLGFAQNYRLLWSRYAEYLLAENRKQEALEHLNQLEHALPLKVNPCDVYCMLLIQSYLNAGDKTNVLALSGSYRQHIQQSYKPGNSALQQEMDYMIQVFTESGMQEEANHWKRLKSTLQVQQPNKDKKRIK